MECRINSNSFEIIYRQHWEAVYAVCYHYTQSRHASEELVQEIFQSLWDRRQNLIIETTLEHYLIRAARLKVVAYLYSKGVHACLSDYHISANAVLYKTLAPTHKPNEKLTRNPLTRALAFLRAGFKEIL